MPSQTDDYLHLAAHVLGLVWDEEDDDQREAVETELSYRFGLDADGWETVASALLRCTMPVASPLRPAQRMHVFGKPEKPGSDVFRAIVREPAG